MAFQQNLVHICLINTKYKILMKVGIANNRWTINKKNNPSQNEKPVEVE